MKTPDTPGLPEIMRRVGIAAQRSNRAPSSIRVIAVTKTRSVEEIEQVLDHGMRDIGENRVQEGVQKKALLKQEARWHLIGPLQRNKARQALEVFDTIQSIDRLKIVERLQSILNAEQPSRRLPVLIQANIGREAQKHGVLPEETLDLAREILANAPNLLLEGLMGIPPLGVDPEEARPFFRELHQLLLKTRDNLGIPLPELSMGMSADFEVAIEEGATMVRVGSAIFGPRKQKNSSPEKGN